DGYRFEFPDQTASSHEDWDKQGQCCHRDSLHSSRVHGFTNRVYMVRKIVTVTGARAARFWDARATVTFAAHPRVKVRLSYHANPGFHKRSGRSSQPSASKAWYSRWRPA